MDGAIACVLHLKIPNAHLWARHRQEEVREKQEKNKDTLPHGPMDELRRKQMLIQRLEGVKRSNTHVLLVLQLAVGMA